MSARQPATRRWQHDVSLYCSGTEGHGRVSRQGVAMVVKNELRSCVADVEPVNGMIQVMTLRGSPNIRIVGCYDPTAQRPSEERLHYTKHYSKLLNRHGYQVVYVLGDVNVRVQIAQEGEQPRIG